MSIGASLWPLSLLWALTPFAIRHSPSDHAPSFAHFISNNAPRNSSPPPISVTTRDTFAPFHLSTRSLVRHRLAWGRLYPRPASRNSRFRANVRRHVCRNGDRPTHFSDVSSAATTGLGTPPTGTATETSLVTWVSPDGRVWVGQLGRKLAK